MLQPSKAGQPASNSGSWLFGDAEDGRDTAAASNSSAYPVLSRLAPDPSESQRDAVLAPAGGNAAEVLQGELPGEAKAAPAGAFVPAGGADVADVAAADIATWTDFVSNDTNFTNGSLWGMYGDQTNPVNAFGSQAGEAWAKGAVGSTKVVVGVVDTGINYTHIDLYLNVWLNQGEIPTSFRSSLTDVDSDGLITFRDLNHAANASFVADRNANGRIDAGDLLNDTRWENGIDEDGNGLRDDLVGWDFFNADNDPWDDNGHGTHVAGTIGAQGGNGTGVAGVAWNTLIVGLKFSGADGAGFVSRATSSLDYFTNQSKSAANADQKFVATNNSWSSGSYSSTLQAAIERAAKADILTVASAGNNSRDSDVTPNYPAVNSTLATVGYEAVISVGSINSAGNLSWFSNWGDTNVDLLAPGEGIVSTLSNGGYGAMSGTSMAAPHVTGALALYASHNLDASGAQMRDALLNSTEATASAAGRTVSGGRLNVDKMLGLSVPPPPPPPEPEPEPTLREEPALTTDPGPEGSGPEPAPPQGALLSGTTGNDTLVGGDGADTISGVPAEGDRRLGHGTVDVLTGGAGADLFVLGDGRGAFYDDGKATQAGMNHYARIMDFEAGDQFQVSSAYATYVFRPNFTRDGFTGTGIFADSNGSGRYDGADEMIALVVGATALSASDLVFV